MRKKIHFLLSLATLVFLSIWNIAPSLGSDEIMVGIVSQTIIVIWLLFSIFWRKDLEYKPPRESDKKFAGKTWKILNIVLILVLIVWYWKDRFVWEQLYSIQGGLSLAVFVLAGILIFLTK